MFKTTEHAVRVYKGYIYHRAAFCFLDKAEGGRTEDLVFGDEVFELVLPLGRFTVIEGVAAESLAEEEIICFASLRGLLVAGVGASRAVSGSDRFFFLTTVGEAGDDVLAESFGTLAFFAVLGSGAEDSIAGFPSSEDSATAFCSFFMSAFAFMAFCRALLTLTASIFAFYWGESVQLLRGAGRGELTRFWALLDDPSFWIEGLEPDSASRASSTSAMSSWPWASSTNFV
jgi:hypothetical protein